MLGLSHRHRYRVVLMDGENGAFRNAGILVMQILLSCLAVFAGNFFESRSRNRVCISPAGRARIIRRYQTSGHRICTAGAACLGLLALTGHSLHASGLDRLHEFGMVPLGLVAIRFGEIRQRAIQRVSSPQ